MKQGKVIIYAGTTEGRRLAEYLLRHGVQVHVCVATSYGESLLPTDDRLTISHDRQDQSQMESLITSYAPDYVVDATHPYAKEVTENIAAACSACGATCLRLVRPSGQNIELSDLKSKSQITEQDCVYVADIQEAVHYLAQTRGNILATTGSKELAAYTALPDYKARVYARVLSIKNVVESCESLGFAGRHLICMQGPFSMEMNLAMLREYQIAYMVTKESGTNGGFVEKQEAARAAGATLIVIGRPVAETGYSYEELCRYLIEQMNLKRKCTVSLVGIGTGAEETFTLKAKQVCQEADLLIGAKRMLQAARGANQVQAQNQAQSQTQNQAQNQMQNQKPHWNRTQSQAQYQEYRPEQIVEYIKEHPEYERVAVVLSGDLGFYSGAKKLRELLSEEDGVSVEMVPGISSVIYLSAKLGVSWEDAVFTSVHGRETHLVSLVQKHPKVFVLVGTSEGVREIGETFQYYGLGHLKVGIGVNLSYTDEQILEGTMEDCATYKGDALAVLYIENPAAEQAVVTHGMPDEAFLRDEVPMTKAEVRSVSLSKMQIRRDSVIYDIGAGTGSVSIEAALQADKGQVYAIEVKPEAADLIRKNQQKFGVDNLMVIEGMAPEAVEDLPAPDIVFIGGSKGHLDEVLDLVETKNPSARVVINAITLETLGETLEYVKQHEICDEEILQMQVAKSRKIKAYHMMTGQNPIYIISFTMNGN
jgi:precorrin-6Y C5,15-methyltransferase (decarboxylating)